MSRYSRAHWAQITARVRKSGSSSFTGKKCVLCGRKFNSDLCPHDWTENDEAIKTVLEDWT